MTGPLSHLRVLDMSRILAGPWAAQTLADLGAEVIKVERVGSGDDTRSWGPPFVRDTDGRETTESAYFLTTNRGKKSLALDISKPEGQAIVRRLAAVSDILIENYKLGGLAAYGLGYDDLKAVNPGLIYCSITGFGQTGPFAGRAGYDFLIQAMGGLMSVTGERDDRPGGGPQKIGVALSDILTGLYTTIAALTGIARRDRTGEGCHVDMALLDVTVAAMANQALNYLVSGIAPKRMGNAHPNIVPYEAFEAADQYLIVAVGNDGQFARFVEVAGRPELAKDDRFATNAARVANRDVLIPIIQDFMKGRSGADWVDALEKVGVPCGPINDMEQVFAHPQVRHRGLRMELPHPLAGTVPQVANPIKFVDDPLTYHRAPPTLGQDTRDILRDTLDMPEAEIEALMKAGIAGG
jgi:crotonobetainyl-CoA:carnitine CoA-transferase CaiB-like acyl-CoA transferase